MLIFYFLSFLVATLAFPNYSNLERDASPCDANCTLPACKCSNTIIPGGLSAKNTPQFVILSFDDGVAVTNINYYRDAFNNKKNPNNCPISGTFFINHEFTDYSLVNELFSKGHELALHSMTHKSNLDYWRDASVDTLKKEFVDQKLTMSTFANVPSQYIKGLRMPFLQMAGNNQFKMMNDNSLLYDCSWSTRSFRKPGLWPYTLKHKTTQDCPIGPCPTESFPNVWVVPMIQWDNDNANHTCSMADTCVNFLDKDLEWMKTEFARQYNGNRAPFGVFIHAAWFTANETRFTVYKQFLEYLGSLPDVYVVGASQVIDWIKAPKTVEEMKKVPCVTPPPAPCEKITCQLKNDEGSERWMTICGVCPVKYPWFGNPLGQ